MVQMEKAQKRLQASHGSRWNLGNTSFIFAGFDEAPAKIEGEGFLGSTCMLLFFAKRSLKSIDYVVLCLSSIVRSPNPANSMH